MVVLQVKFAVSTYASSPLASPPEAEETEFLYECAASTAVADVAAALGSLAGPQERLLTLCRRLRERCANSVAASELERALDEAEAYASKEQVQRNRFLSPRVLREHIKNIEKKFATALQESPGILSAHQPPSDNQNREIELWWAGKRLAMDRRLCNYIGANDKTKIVIKLAWAPNEPDCTSTLE